MPSSTEPRSALKYGWNTGESGWGADMTANLLRLGRFGFHVSVKSRSLATPPGSPAAGDSYIVAASPTGAWASFAGHVVIWDGVSAWVSAGAPRLGWVVGIEDEPGIGSLRYDGTAWRQFGTRPLADFVADATSTGTTETDLFSATLPANAFAAAGEEIEADYGLQLLGALTATRRVRVYLAGTAIYDSGAMAATATGSCSIRARILRDGASSVRYQVDASATGSAAPACAVGKLTGLTFSGTMVLKITGQSGGTGSANGDITAILGKIRPIPAT